MTPDEIRDVSIEKFMLLARSKYNAGQREHGGNLVENVKFKDLEDEIIDLWFYVQSLRMKLEREEKGIL